jgi:hypothetical protein
MALSYPLAATHDDSAKYYPNTPTGKPHLPPGLIGAIVLLALIVVMWWLTERAPRSSLYQGTAHAAKRALKRVWLPIARVVRRKKPAPADDDDQRPSTSSMS